MATYTELLELRRAFSPLRNKVQVAVVIAANAIRTEDPATDNHANRLVWSRGVFENSEREADRMCWAVLAANKDLDLPAIQGASDSAVQTQVDAAVNHFATG